MMPVSAIRILVAALAIALSTTSARAEADAMPFHEQVDLTPLATVAVQSDGRIKSFSSLASEMMGYVSGPRRIAGQDPAFTYLDMLFRPDEYRRADVVFVKGAGPREKIAEAILRENLLPEMAEKMRGFRKSGLISENLLTKPEVLAVLREMQADLLRTAKVVDSIESALNVKDPRFLLAKLRIVPRGDGDANQPWHGIAEVMFADGKEPVPGAMLMLAEKSEPPEDVPLGARTARKAFHQQTGEELLRQIPRVVGRIPVTSREGVHRIPIGAAQPVQRRLGLR